MDAERWDLVQRVFHEAVEVPEENRRDFVRAACGDAPEIEEDVLALLAEDGTGDSILDRDVGLVAGELFHGSATIPRAIGPYRLTRPLGEGGMGVVYLAERDDLDNRTAIKFLRDARLSPERRERFSREQRFLAQLSHPSICRLYDASTLADGTPYFVMEYVDGLAVTEYCERHELPVDQRLKLFRQVCEAVQYAHRQALIHRDLKPSNILALDGGKDGEPTIKLLDFGIAKQTEPEGGPLSTQTSFGPMTPSYAAPEQMRGGTVGVSTDVYALGVLLYELLTGSLPFDLSGASFFEAAQTKSSQDPEKPSARITRSGVAPGFAAGVDKRAWADLDALCLKAMNKDPEERYQTVEALLRDVDHYLGGEPLEARVSSIAYIGRKFIARNRLAVAGVALALLVLLSFTLTLSLQAERLVAERDRANRAATASENVARILSDLLKSSDPARAQGETVTSRELLDQAAAELDEDLEPEIRAQLLDIMGQVYHKLGEYPRAQSLLEEALALRRSRLGAGHPKTLETGSNLGALFLDQSKFKAAAKLLAEVLEAQRRVLDPDEYHVLETTWRLADAYKRLSRYAEAEPLFQQVVEVRRRRLGEEDVDTLGALGNLGTLYRSMGRYAEAEAIDRRLLASYRKTLGPKHPSTCITLQNLGMVLISMKRFAEAEPTLAEAAELGSQIHGERHPITLNTRSALAVAQQGMGHYDDAERNLKEVLKIEEEEIGPRHFDTFGTKNNLADLYVASGRYEEARELFEEVLAGLRQILEEGHPMIAVAIHNLAKTNRELGNYGLARAQFEEAGKLWEARLGPEHPYIAENLEQYALLLRKTGDAAAAEGLEARARAIREKNSP